MAAAKACPVLAAAFVVRGTVGGVTSDQRSSALARVLEYLGFREGDALTAEERRTGDLIWAVVGPCVIVLFVWTLLGQTLGMVAVLVMLPFLVVGVRDVLSGRAEERRLAKRDA